MLTGGLVKQAGQATVTLSPALPSAYTEPYKVCPISAAPREDLTSDEEQGSSEEEEDSATRDPSLTHKVGHPRVRGWGEVWGQRRGRTWTDWERPHPIPRCSHPLDPGQCLETLPVSEEVWGFPKSLWVIQSGAACSESRQTRILVCPGLSFLVREVGGNQENGESAVD